MVFHPHVSTFRSSSIGTLDLQAPLLNRIFMSDGLISYTAIFARPDTESICKRLASTTNDAECSLTKPLATDTDDLENLCSMELRDKLIFVSAETIVVYVTLASHPPSQTKLLRSQQRILQKLL